MPPAWYDPQPQTSRKEKTAVMMAFRGPGCTALKRKYHGAKLARTLRVIGEHCSYQVHDTGEYRHLAGVLHISGDLKKEARRRLAQAHSALSQHRKILYQNASITLIKRMQLFQTIVLSQLTYGMETWVLDDSNTKPYVHSQIMRLYTGWVQLTR